MASGFDKKKSRRRSSNLYTIPLVIIAIGLLAIIKLEIFPTPPECFPESEKLVVPTKSTNCAITFLLSSNSYFPCLAVVLHSLELVDTKIDVVVQVTPNIFPDVIEALSLFKVHIVDITAIKNPNPKVKLRHLTDNFTKMRAWQLADYKKIVYSDIDFLYVRNSDDLCELPAAVYAGRNWNTSAGDWPDPDFFNAGFMVIDPSTETYCQLYQKSAHTKTKSGGDQQFQNEFWAGRWTELDWDLDGMNANAYYKANDHWHPEAVRSFHFTRKTNPCNHRNVAEIHALWEDLEKNGIAQEEIDRKNPMILWYLTYQSLLEIHPDLSPLFRRCNFMTGRSDTGRAYGEKPKLPSRTLGFA
jgi:hypothetical protein